MKRGSRSHSIPQRIVSLSQPWVRPTPGGKARAKTEFGAKLHISLVGGYVCMERLSFAAYNEADDFYHIVERYRRRNGRYPDRILADRIYRNQQTLAFYMEHDIRLTGPALGRPPKDQTLSREQKRQEYADLCDRNPVEGSRLLLVWGGLLRAWNPLIAVPLGSPCSGLTFPRGSASSLALLDL